MFSVLKSKLNCSNFRSRTSPFLVSSSSLSTCVPYFRSSSIWTPKYLTLSTIGMSTAVSNFTQVGSGPTGISSRSSLAFVTSVSPSLRIIAPFPSNGLPSSFDRIIPASSSLLIRKKFSPDVLGNPSLQYIFLGQSTGIPQVFETDSAMSLSLHQRSTNPRTNKKEDFSSGYTRLCFHPARMITGCSQCTPTSILMCEADMMLFKQLKDKQIRNTYFRYKSMQWVPSTSFLSTGCSYWQFYVQAAVFCDASVQPDAIEPWTKSKIKITNTGFKKSHEPEVDNLKFNHYVSTIPPVDMEIYCDGSFSPSGEASLIDRSPSELRTNFLCI